MKPVRTESRLEGIGRKDCEATHFTSVPAGEAQGGHEVTKWNKRHQWEGSGAPTATQKEA